MERLLPNLRQKGRQFESWSVPALGLDQAGDRNTAPSDLHSFAAFHGIEQSRELRLGLHHAQSFHARRAKWSDDHNSNQAFLFPGR
jgi:hypothetical protein